MTSPDVASAVLAEHPWVAATYPGSTGVLVLLSLTGLLTLRSGGRQSLLERLQGDLALPTGSSSLRLRLLDFAPPASDFASIDHLLQAPRPSRAITLAETERDGHWTLSLLLPLELTQFDGHFPQAPVLPGVLQVAWALALAAPRLHTSMRCRAMKGLKFQRLLHPGDHVELRLHLDRELADAGGSALHFGYRVDARHCSSGRLIVGQAHE